MQTHTHTHARTHTHTYIRIYIHTYTWSLRKGSPRNRNVSCVYVCMCTNMYVYTYTYTHIHAHTHTNKHICIIHTHTYSSRRRNSRKKTYFAALKNVSTCRLFYMRMYVYGFVCMYACVCIFSPLGGPETLLVNFVQILDQSVPPTAEVLKFQNHCDHTHLTVGCSGCLFFKSDSDPPGGFSVDLL